MLSMNGKRNSTVNLNETFTTAPIVDIAQRRPLGLDRAIGPAQDETRRRPIDIAEKCNHHGAEHADTDQRQSEGC